MRWILRFALLMIFLTACGQNNTPTPTPEPTLTPTPNLPTLTPTPDTSISGVVLDEESVEPGTIRVVHAAVDTPSINLIAGIQAIVTNLNYASATEPTPLDAGDYDIKVVASGSRPNDPALLETSFNLEGGASLLLVVAKRDEQLTLLTFPETVEPVNPGESLVTVINAVESGASLQVARDGTDITEAIPFGEVRTSDILPSGDTTFDFTVSDQTQPHSLTLEETQHYTLIVSGTPDNISVTNYSTQAPGQATVRAIHASASLSAVDVYLDENQIAENAQFGRPVARQEIISGQFVVNVFAAGADRTAAEPILTQIVDLTPGDDTSLVLLGTEDNLILMSYIEDLSPTPSDKARVAFLTTLPDVPSVHIETSGGPLPDFPDLRFGEPPQSTLLAADSQDFYLTRPDNTVENPTVETIQNVQLEAGTYYLFLVTGRQDTQPVVLSDDVGIDESLSPEQDIAAHEASAENPSLVRFVNALGDQSTLDFEVNGTTIPNVAYGTGSELVAVGQPNVTFSTTISGDTTPAQFLEESLASGSLYTVIAHGRDNTDVRLLVVPDDTLVFDGRSPYLRLITLSSNSDVSLGLGFSAPSPTPESGTAPEPFNDIRRTMPGGVQRLVENIMGVSYSPVILMPMGTFDIYIIDTGSNQLANLIPGMQLEAGQHYDIIAYEEPDTTRIQLFVVQYPPIPGSN